MKLPDHSKLLFGILIGVVLGILAGTYFPAQAVHFGFLGKLFLNALRMIVLPLIVTSLIVGITNLEQIERLGKIGLNTILYYVLTTSIAVILGIILVDWIKPGIGHGVFVGELPEKIRGAQALGLSDILLSLVHPNLVLAALEFQILPIILFSILFGISLSLLGENARVAVYWFRVMNDAIMQIVHWIMVFAPFGIFGLIAERLGTEGGGDAFWALIGQVAKYTGTVILGLLIHGALTLPVLLLILTRKNPFVYFIQLAKALATAFATASSSATLPVTLRSAEEAGVSKRSAGFVLPLGATVNMDGTALYEAVAAIFIAQSYGITLGLAQKGVIFLTATLAAIGAAGIPEAGLVTMVLVLQAVGLPVEGLGLILAIDWFLDRCRTTVNVWGDAVGAAVIDRFEGRGNDSKL